MLSTNNKSISQMRIGAKTVSALYRGSKKIWEAVSSCFGSGVWKSSKPWKNKDAWK